MSALLSSRLSGAFPSCNIVHCPQKEHKFLLASQCQLQHKCNFERTLKIIFNGISLLFYFSIQLWAASQLMVCHQHVFLYPCLFLTMQFMHCVAFQYELLTTQFRYWNHLLHDYDYCCQLRHSVVVQGGYCCLFSCSALMQYSISVCLLLLAQFRHTTVLQHVLLIFFSSSGIAWCLSVFTVACFSFRMLYFAAHWVPSDLGFFFSGLWGLFLERPGNLTGPESDFDISLKKRRACSDF